jgi:alpha-1,3-fucosyltransferase
MNENSENWQCAIMKSQLLSLILGKCGTIPCANRTGTFPCDYNISKDYKFYLSFENSICTDYVTEKLFNTMMLPIVPIVMG